ncbi:DUF4197 domain-containing protein [Aurantiacibacter flavus]|uniref:DUF4197 domain-containing protein n=1 Tax=Aurantiacibacter flavus TaxID=3145232 RepID=A0ABV0CY15_9SPHN
MTDNVPSTGGPGLGRRLFLGGAVGGAVLMLPGCASMGGGFSLEDAVRRLLYLSSERAFAKMAAEGGYWDNAVDTIGLENLLGTRGNVLASILTSNIFKQRLNDSFADLAIDAADRAAPLVTDAVRTIGIANALALVRGGPSAATSYLRGEMGNALIEAMVPELGEAMRIAQDPLVGELLTGLTGIDVAGVSRNFSTRINDAIWSEIGGEESAIRANPRATNDPLLIGVFGVGAQI